MTTELPDSMNEAEELRDALLGTIPKAKTTSNDESSSLNSEKEIWLNDLNPKEKELSNFEESLQQSKKELDEIEQSIRDLDEMEDLFQSSIRQILSKDVLEGNAGEVKDELNEKLQLYEEKYKAMEDFYNDKIKGIEHILSGKESALEGRNDEELKKELGELEVQKREDKIKELKEREKVIFELHNETHRTKKRLEELKNTNAEDTEEWMEELKLVVSVKDKKKKLEEKVSDLHKKLEEKVETQRQLAKELKQEQLSLNNLANQEFQRKKAMKEKVLIKELKQVLSKQHGGTLKDKKTGETTSTPSTKEEEKKEEEHKAPDVHKIAAGLKQNIQELNDAISKNNESRETIANELKEKEDKISNLEKEKSVWTKALQELESEVGDEEDLSGEITTIAKKKQRQFEIDEILKDVQKKLDECSDARTKILEEMNHVDVCILELTKEGTKKKRELKLLQEQNSDIKVSVEILETPKQSTSIQNGEQNHSQVNMLYATGGVMIALFVILAVVLYRWIIMDSDPNGTCPNLCKYDDMLNKFDFSKSHASSLWDYIPLGNYASQLIGTLEDYAYGYLSGSEDYSNANSTCPKQ